MLSFVLRSLATVWLPLLVFMGLAGGVARASGSAAVEQETLQCLTPRLVSAVRSAPAMAVKLTYRLCRREFTAKTAALDLTDELRAIAFASVLAHAMAPYGSSQSITLEDLLADEVMDCDNYALLTGYFSRLLVDEKAALLRFAGFDGGMVGNHAQIFVGRKGEHMMLDPTIGLVAKAGFNDVLMGKPVPRGQMLVFRMRTDAAVEQFTRTVVRAVETGRYRPTDMLYFFPSMEQYVQFGQEIAPLWEGDVDALMRRFPSPGAAALRKQLSSAPD